MAAAAMASGLFPQSVVASNGVATNATTYTQQQQSLAAMASALFANPGILAAMAAVASGATPLSTTPATAPATNNTASRAAASSSNFALPRRF